MVITTDLYKDAWEVVEPTKNVPNANKVTDIINYVFRCTYTIQMFTRC